MLTAEEQAITDKFWPIFNRQFAWARRRWKGTEITKYPMDLFIYQMLIFENKPDIIVEAGTSFGGSASFFASMCDMIGHGQILTVDNFTKPNRPVHPRIEYFYGRSTAADTMEKVKAATKGKTCMVVLDSDHRASHVKRELIHYSPYVTPNQYLVVEDTMLNTKINWRQHPSDSGPLGAVKWFLGRNNEFIVEPLNDWFVISMNTGGWLRRKGPSSPKPVGKFEYFDIGEGE